MKRGREKEANEASYKIASHKPSLMCAQCSALLLCGRRLAKAGGVGFDQFGAGIQVAGQPAHSLEQILDVAVEPLLSSLTGRALIC
jgi:hypothetical protein